MCVNQNSQYTHNYHVIKKTALNFKAHILNKLKILYKLVPIKEVPITAEQPLCCLDLWAVNYRHKNSGKV